MSPLTRLCVLVLGAALLTAVAGCDDTSCRLCDAVRASDVAVTRSLVASGDPVSSSVLETAVEEADWVGTRAPSPQDLEILALLIDRGDPNASWTTTSRGRASSVGSSRRCYFSAGVVGAGRQDPALVRRLLARGLDVRGTPGGEALHKAVALQAIDVVRVLLDAGAPVNHPTTCDTYPMTPLHVAIQARDLKMIALLEAAGAVEWTD